MDITSMLQFGPKTTMAPKEGAPSIYADPTEWEAYRARQMLLASLEADQKLAAENKVKQDQAANQLVTDLGSGQDSMTRELQSLLGRYPTRAALSPQASLPGKPDDAPSLPTGQNPQHAKQDIINKNWNSEGIQAFTDAKGQLVLTNNPAAKDATTAMQPFTPVGSTATGGGANKLLTDLRNAKDLADAQGIAYSLQSSITEQVGKLQTDAIRFAEQKGGLPAMRQELQNAIAADRRDPLYKPGMGDSPITAKIRLQISAMEDQAQQEADRWLSRNTSYAQLKNTLSVASSELQRFTRQADWKDQRRMSSELAAEEWDRRKKEEQKVKAGQIPIETRDRILKLHPEIANQEDPDMALMSQYEQLMKKGGKVAADALNAPTAQLPGLAVRGNTYAEEFVIQEEMAATGESADTIRGRIASSRALMSDPKFVQQAMNAKFASAPDKSKKVKEAMADFNAKSNDNTPEGKERFNMLKSELVLDYARSTATERFTKDLSRIQTTNAKLGDAIRLAQKNSGSASLADVAAAWVGEATGPEAIASYNALIGVLEAEGMKYRNSMFGAPNMVAIRAAVNEMARANFTVLGRIKSFVNAPSTAGFVERGTSIASPAMRAFQMGTTMATDAIDRSMDPGLNQ